MITLINVFTVDPRNQPQLICLLTRATDEFVCRAAGFVTSTLHRSLDGSKVTMYAQWRSVEDYQAMRQDPGPMPLFEEALAIAKFEPGIYAVNSSPVPRTKPSTTTLIFAGKAFVRGQRILIGTSPPDIPSSTVFSLPSPMAS